MLQFLYPELTRFTTREEEIAAYVKASQQAGLPMRNTWPVRHALIVWISVVVLWSAALGVCAFTFPSPSFLVGVAIFVCSVGIVTGIVLRFRNPIRRELRRILVDKGVPICIACGYDLRALPPGRCPECGAPPELELETTENSGTCHRDSAG